MSFCIWGRPPARLLLTLTLAHMLLRPHILLLTGTHIALSFVKPMSRHARCVPLPRWHACCNARARHHLSWPCQSQCRSSLHFSGIGIQQVTATDIHLHDCTVKPALHFLHASCNNLQPSHAMTTIYCKANLTLLRTYLHKWAPNVVAIKRVS